ncbi:MAG: hypothetical protein RBQ97_07180 [Acholeplasma sp.]|nr:hypothetical protein [Acholeplasma sp.]
MKKIMMIYEKLNNHYQEQNWWPAETFLEMVLGAILVQNTQWRQVEKSIENLKDILNVYALETITVLELESLIAPSGFAKRKVQTIKSFLSWFKMYNYDFNTIKQFDAKKIRNELLSILGIGPETADSILLYGLDKPFFIVDTYLRRLFKRVNLPSFSTYDEYQSFIQNNITQDIYVFKQFHALIVAYGKDLNTIYKELNVNDPLYDLRVNYIQYHESHLNYLKKKDPIINKLITNYGWVNRKALPSYYHALIYAITGQLVSAKMADVLYKRFFEKFSSISDVTNTTIEDIKSIGLTQKRAKYIYDISKMIESNELDLNQVANLKTDEAIDTLTSLPGIGIWSAKIILMHGYQKLDITTYEDLGLRKALFSLYDVPQTKKSYETIMEKFAPYRTIVSIYLWEYYHRNFNTKD